MSEYKASEDFIVNFPGNSIKVADLACGIGWTSALISKIDKVKEVHSVEISEHRLGLLFEHCMKMLSGNKSKIHRYIGSFYNLKFKSNSIDIVYMSQGFHHADAPLHLLVECDRVLKSNGRIILVGEHFIGFKRIVKRFFSTLIRSRKITFDFYELWKPDDILGDHYYKVVDYFLMFRLLGYSLAFKRLGNGTVIYVADKIR